MSEGCCRDAGDKVSGHEVGGGGLCKPEGGGSLGSSQSILSQAGHSNRSYVHRCRRGYRSGEKSQMDEIQNLGKHSCSVVLTVNRIYSLKKVWGRRVADLD